MDRRHAPSPPHTDAVPDEIIERMHQADSLVRPWVDAAFRARINPDVPEVVGPPTRMKSRRIRHRT
jgi:hypothetical protein